MSLSYESRDNIQKAASDLLRYIDEALNELSTKYAYSSPVIFDPEIPSVEELLYDSKNLIELYDSLSDLLAEHGFGV